MLKDSCQPKCQTDQVSSDIVSRDWKAYITKLRQEYSVRVKLAASIREKEFLSWGTPNTMDSLPSRSYEAMKKAATNGGRKNRERPGNLREQVDPLMCQAYQDAKKEANMYPTPQASEAEKAGYYNKGQMGQSLSAMANRGELNDKNQNWLTPTACEVEQDLEKFQKRMEKYPNGTTMPSLSNQVKQEMNWPTARTSDAEGGRIETEMTDNGFRSKRNKSDQYFGAKLRDAVETLHNQPDQDNNNTGGNHQESYPTPIAGDWKGQVRSDGNPTMLSGIVEKDAKNWATPQASDYVEGARTSLQSNQKCLGRDLKQLEMVDKKPQSMRLNPRWVEVLMGLPVGWCMPSCVTPWITEQTNSVS
jgi:hypothetical protein